jgi:hypothetical protein
MKISFSLFIEWRNKCYNLFLDVYPVPKIGVHSYELGSVQVKSVNKWVDLGSIKKE